MGPAVQHIEEFTNSEPIMSRLEDFFASPDFTAALGQFMGENCHNVEFVPAEDEQPLQNHDIFCKYTGLVETLLNDFMKCENLSSEEVYEACRRVKEGGENAWVTCVDYLLAATEYTHFMQLIADFRRMEEYDGEEGEMISLAEYEIELAC
ncbi:hypothetical protein CYMTET_21041 [Cymbomonas tetramitiformis]|uniref:Cilia- and flagella-associated protein 36 n=1 Tax=Cymbomonas tetramitiformis TaxID=36881 RepID=A0AAE0G2V9_9CHLO|nr:hypothetical protein CYMTET_21041 [Cymbomonas tetramitiformis]